jgi:glycosyltransferase involved in cell wall biosynthesis
MKTDDSGIKVSVLMPTYNGAAFIAEAIESVLAQTLGNFELIIADDGSVDGTVEIIEQYAKRDDRIVSVRNERNLGCVKNINHLLLLAKAPYVKILIQDDVIAPAYLEECANILDTHSHVLLVTTFQKFIGGSEAVRKLPILPAIGELDGKLVQRHVLTHGNWIGGETAVMIRKSSLCVGLLKVDWVWQVDQDMWIRILAEGNLYVVPKILSFSRIHDKQGTVFLNKDFTYVKEELMQLKVAFLFPSIYGEYSRAEQKALYREKFNRLIREGLAKKDNEWRAHMIKIGLVHKPIQFGLLLVATLVERMKAVEWVTSFFSVRRERFTLWLESIRAESWKKTFGYHDENKIVDIGFSTVPTIGRCDLPIDMLRSPVMTCTGIKVVRIEDTPHYCWINDLMAGRDDSESRSKYRTYLELFHPDESIESTLEKIVLMVKTVKANEHVDFPWSIVVHPVSKDPQSNRIALIYDGNHRACMAKAQGRTSIECRIVEQQMPAEYFSPHFFKEMIATHD